MEADREHQPDPEQQELTKHLLREEVARRKNETAIERVLKSSLVGVLAGSMLTIVANEMTERRRARERAEDALQQRTQATLQVVDELATIVYRHSTQALLLSDATTPFSTQDKDGRFEMKKSYEEAYTKSALTHPFCASN